MPVVEAEKPNEVDRHSDKPPAPPHRPLSAWRTLRFGVRGGWDALGFVCAMSLTLFIVAPVPLWLALRSFARLRTGGLLGVVLGAALFLAVVPPLYAGACWLTRRIVTHDEPSYLDLWRGFARLYVPAVGLGAIQAGIGGILAANLLFYLSRGGVFFLVLGVVFLYIAAFWQMNALYHWPLLVASAAGDLPRDEGAATAARPSLRAVLRNGFLLAASAPGYTLALLAVLTVVAVPLLISGVGAALLLTGLAVFVTTQATRDQLVRFGVLPAPPDPDEPVVEEVWRVR